MEGHNYSKYGSFQWFPDLMRLDDVKLACVKSWQQTICAVHPKAHPHATSINNTKTAKTPFTKIRTAYTSQPLSVITRPQRDHKDAATHGEQTLHARLHPSVTRLPHR